MPFPSRRRFLTQSAALAGSASILPTLMISRTAYAAGGDTVRIALIGCGGRGTGAAIQALSNKSMSNVKLVAMADAFRERLDGCLAAVQSNVKDKTKIDVPEDRKFVGLDAYQKAIDAGVDMVLICTPPGFRPSQFEAAVKAGKHVFMEKPIATDAPGVQRVLKTNETAKQKGLLVAVGHHLRHEEKHCKIIERIHDGAIGDLQYMRAYFNSGGVWVRPRKPNQSEMEYQVQNWYYFTWLSGDHIVEQHVHDLDVCNWMMKDAHPVEANGMGGRQVRIGKDYGEIFDHHAVEFTYPDGTKMFSYSRHMPGCWGSFSQHAKGAKGYASIQGHGTSVLEAEGQDRLKLRRTADGHQVEHDDLFAALRDGRPYNECDWAANSTMTAILGRMATYSGQVVKWDEALASTIDLAPAKLTWDAEPKVKPGADGLYPCAIPGVTRVI